ncbi:MAG TPA: HEAT repeat domain-containing protein [Gemmataceae bacterium]|nr:HEAT repeat domain-containing protein [Gemmataceae bacterium]
MRHAISVVCPLTVLLAGCTKETAKVANRQNERPKAAVIVRLQEPAPPPMEPKADPETEVERWLFVLQDRKHPDRGRAAEELGRLGRRAKKAIPALADALDVPLAFPLWKQRHPGQNEQQHAAAVALHQQARDALISIGPESASALIAAVRADREVKPQGVCTFRSAVESALLQWSPEILPVLLDAAAEWDVDHHRDPCLKVLVRLGPEAVPELRKALHDKRPALRARSAALLGDLGPRAAAAAGEVREALQDPDPNVRLAAAYGLCDRVVDDRERAFPVLLTLFQEEAPLTPRLLRLTGFSFTLSPWPVLAGRAAHFDDWYWSAESHQIMWAPGPHPQHRCQVAGRLLAEYGPKAEAILPRLAEWVEHAPPRWPPWSGTVCAMGPTAKRLAPSLVGILQRATAAEREWDSIRPVWHALESMGPSAAADPKTIPTLVAMLKENPESTAIPVALRYIGPDAGALAAPLLSDMLRHKNAEVRWRAFQTLSVVAPVRAVEAVPALAGFPTPFKDSPKRLSSIHWCMGLPDSEESKVWHDSRAFDAYTADLTKAIRALRPKDRDAIPILAGFLHRSTRAQSTEVLAFFGRLEPSAAGDVIPVALEHIATDRESVAYCIEHFGVNAAPALADALKSKSRGVRELAGESLGKLGPDAKTVVPAVRAALNEVPEQDRLPAIEVLGRIGPDAREAVPDLVKLVGGGQQDLTVDAERTSATVARALGRIGKDAVPPLIEALKDTDPRIRAGAAAAFGRIGPDAKTGVVHLLRLRDSTQEPVAVRDAARKALIVLDPD